MLKQLNAKNDVLILSVQDAEFRTYGRVLEGYDFTELVQYMETQTEIPESGNVYVASVPEMEKISVVSQVEKALYGDMAIQVGYCNGKNSTYNGFEYHKGSEINIAVTDFMLVLGHTWDIREDNTYLITDAQPFYVPKGTAIEMFQTTLHLSPCKVSDEGFKGGVILPRGTNTPLEERNEHATGEEQLLLQRNKWVIAHPDREPLVKQGAFPGVIGVNKELYY